MVARRGDREGDSHHLDEKGLARRGDREGDSHHLGSHHLGAVSGAFNQRGRRWFTWRSLHPGRRARRPDTDLSTPPRLGCPVGARSAPLARGHRDSGEGDSHHLDLDVDEESCDGCQPGKGSRICRFCSRSPSLMVARRGNREGDRCHHLDEESCDGCQPGKGSRICRFCSRSPSLMVARRGDREGDSHHLGSHHLGAVSGAFPVNQRGRRWFTWRSLHPGRRVRRPDTDLSTPPRVGCPVGDRSAPLARGHRA